MTILREADAALKAMLNDEPAYKYEPVKSVKRKPVRTTPKIGPNNPCPCGSGKKYKYCCG